MPKSGSIVYQVKKRFRDLDAIGTPKGAGSDGKIHAIQTMRTYLHHSLEFATWCRENYNVKNLDAARPYVKNFIERQSGSLSPWTRKAERSALAKLYGCTAQDLGPIETGARSRATVKRSRGPVTRDRHFAEEGKYRNYVAFCRATGLRRAEITALTGDAFYRDSDGKAWLAVTKDTKGGRHRLVPVIGDAALVEKACKEAGRGSVLKTLTGHSKVPSGTDTHSYRADYAKSLYEALARPVEALPARDRYICRKDRAGVVYDRKAMEKVSQALGHTRVSVIAISYLR